MSSMTARIRENFGSLSPRERELATTILEFPGDVASYSATELAEIAGVNKMTVTRLVRRLGFANYDEARLASRAATVHGSPLHRLQSARDAQPTDLTYEQHLLQCVESISETAKAIDPEVFSRVVDALAQAPRVWILGFRNSANLASYARWQFTQLRPNVHLNVQSAETLGETFADVTCDDLLLLIGTRRRPRIFPSVMKAATALNARLVYMGDAHSAVEAPLPDLSILCATRSVVPLDNHAAVLSVIHALAAELFRRLGAKARRRIQRVGEIQEALDEI
jgi:DNA-binding MurR/RpiR family transcriptional regulator